MIDNSTSSPFTEDLLSLVEGQAIQELEFERGDVANIIGEIAQDDGVANVIASSVGIIEQVIGADEVENDANSLTPTGSSGENIYSDNNKESPDQPVIARGREAITYLSGFGEELSQDLRNWQNVLRVTNQAELKLLRETLPTTGKTIVMPFIKELEQSFKTAATAAVALQNDYSQGNEFAFNNNIFQSKSKQFRVGADNLATIKSPLFINGSKQNLTQAEQIFTQADISHNTFKHLWVRSEWGENYMSLRRESYIIDENITYAANDTNYAGGRTFYSDGFTHSIGRIDFMHLHPERSRPSRYGTSTTHSVANQNYRSSLGSVNTHAFNNVNIASAVGLVTINSWSLGGMIRSGLSGLKRPKQMSDPPEYEKRDFSAPGSGAISINGKTPIGNNTKQGASHPFSTSYGEQGLTNAINISSEEVDEILFGNADDNNIF